MKIAFLSVVALVATTSTAAAGTLDFEDFVAGDVISTFSTHDLSGTVTAVGGVNQAMVFDSRNYTGGDSDLQSPFYAEFTGTRHNSTPVPGTATLNPGNILIISEDGDASDPDDNAGGGTITFNFDRAITFNGFDVLDDVLGFSVTADTGESINDINLTYDRQFMSFSNLGWENVRSLTFDIGRRSGAIDNIQYEVAGVVPLPASMVLLLGGLGALGLSRRARTKA